MRTPPGHHHGRSPAFLAALVDCLLPRICAICDDEIGRGAICATCRAALGPAPAPERLAGMEVRAVMRHAGGGRALIHALKYAGRRDVAAVIAELACSSYRRDGPPRCDLLVPIPLHGRRELRRGYNQSRLLALALGERLGKPVVDLLVRRRPTATQTRLSVAERERNVAGVFSTRHGRRPWWRLRAHGRPAPPQRAHPVLAGRRVLLVDDVLTTGATLGAGAAVLRAAGAVTVAAQVAARAELEDS